MALLNLFTGAILWSGYHPDVRSLAERLNISTPFLHLVAALVLLTIAARLHRTRSPGLAWVVRIWSIADVSLVNLFLYAHPGLRYVSPWILFAAVLGVSGAMRLERLKREGCSDIELAQVARPM